VPAAFLAALLLCSALAPVARAQLAAASPADTIRVTVSQHPDGSRTAYQFDPANKKAKASTTDAAGKSLGTINYELDDQGRFARGESLDAAGRFQFKAIYKYNAAGQLQDEVRLTKQDVVQMKLVYSYNTDGQQSGYAVYDPNGKLLGETTPRGSTPRNSSTAGRSATPAPPKRR
jgi:YD repeat-containing protein